MRHGLKSERTAMSTFDRVAASMTHVAFPEIAAALRSRIPSILRRWRAQSLRTVPYVAALTLEQFENTLAPILEATADTLESADPRRLRGVIERGPQHGIDRFVQDYSVLDLFEEVRILRGVIVAELTEEMRRAPQAAESATFHAVFDIVIQQGVMALLHEQSEQQGQLRDTTRDMNERLLVSAARQHELTARAKHMARLIQTEAEALADASRRKDEFLAMLSHELRNPLAPIRSAVDLLKLHERDAENPMQRHACGVIERQVVSLTKMINDLLEVSRFATGRIRLNLEVVDLNAVVGQALETTRALLERHRHHVAVHLESAPVWVRADPTRLEEVIVNLLDNAAKYTAEGGAIAVHCERQQGQALVRVRDNGVGIEPGLLPHVFDLFTQADRSLARSAGGLGIGLSLAHSLVLLHGGTIEASSPLEGGQGTMVTVRLPLAPTPLGDQPRPREAPADRLPGLRVLVVDDNADLVTMLASALRHKGYVVEVADNGFDALRTARQWRPDVILLDIGLPNLDGYEVARRLRGEPLDEDGQGFKGRLIALTGYARGEDIAKIQAAGFDAYLIKPCEFAELEELMCPPPARG